MPRTRFAVLSALLLVAATVAAAQLADDEQCMLDGGRGCEAAAGVVEEEVQLMQESIKLVKGQGSIHSKTRQRVSSASLAASAASLQDAAVTTDTTTTTIPPTGVTLNAAGDLTIFLTGVVTYGVFALMCVAFFNAMRTRYPIMYAHNAIIGLVNIMPDETSWGWYRASRELKIEEAIESIGLDNAMMIEFTHMCMKIMATIGIPMFCIIGPMNCIFGGNAAGDDHLSYFSFGNVEFGSWLYWVHAPCVWCVVFVVQTNVYAAQRKFLSYRYTWLRKMAEKRANTVMVDNIPVEYQSDAKLGDFFNKILPGENNVKRAYVTKDTTHLLHLTNELKRAEDALHKAEAQWEKNRAEGKGRPTVGGGCCGGKELDSIEHYTKLIQDLKPQVEAEREKVLTEAASGVGGVNLSNGFVTFTDRMQAEVALRLTGITEDKEELITGIPPEPSDIQWADLTQDVNAQQGRTFLGYALTIGLYFAYMPVVIGITNAANLVDMGPLQAVWASVAPTAGLQFMVAMLPTFLITIFKLCFTLKAAAWAQHKLQLWYFVFQVVFVILITAVGQDVTGFTEALLSDPFSLFGVMADTMPYATHYYMNYLVLQWMAHGMVLTRYVPLSKFKFLCQIFSEEEAKEMAEPEDQDYYGLGSRSAQWATVMLIGIIYGTLSPPINVLTFITFAIMRLFYGYIIVFAETKKPDLGGVFWVAMMRHMFIGLFIYGVLMTGVFYRRAATSGPMLIAAPTIFYTLWSLNRFDSAFAWESLPFKELTDESTASMKKRALDGEYIQPELIKA